MFSLEKQVSDDSILKLWQVLNKLSLAILLYDNKNNTYCVNTAAQILFDLKHCDNLDSAAFNAVTLLSVHNNKHIAIESLFDSKTSTNIQLKKQQQSIPLNIALTQLSDSVSMLCLEPLKSDVIELYNFDRVISEISTDLIDIQNDDIDLHINFALKAIGTAFAADRSYLFEFNTDNETITNTHEWVNEGIEPFKQRLQNVPKTELPYFFEVMNATHLFQVNDVLKLPQAANAEKVEFQIQKIQSVLCIGLLFDKELIGFIGCDCVNFKRAWTHIDLIRIKLVGEIIANALKNIDYKKKLQLAQQQLITANQKLSLLVNTDGLTNIANRRCFDETLKSEIQRCARNKHSLSLIMCDIDFFKRYNDNYGHQKGDDALKQVAKTLNKLCRREGDLAARYGGEEFAIILPSLNAAECHQFALLLQQKIALLNIVHSDSSVAKTLTLSVGFYSTYPTKNTRPETIINNADAALYEAKETGRNKICQFFESN